MTNARDKANIPVLNFQSKGIDDNADATAVTINSSEQVGIGTTSPDHLLHISANSTNAQLKLQRTGSATASYNISASSDGLAFSNQVAGSEVMRITSTGLGIGTSSPDTILSLEQNNAPRIQYKDTSGGTDAKVWRTMGLDSDYRLETRSDNLSNGQLAYVATRSGYVVNEHKFFTSDSERMRINSSGDLLIGKTTNAFNELGTTIRAGDEPMYITRDNNYVILVNRKSSDGDLVRFYKSTSQKGSISVSGETVSYNGFTGSHWSRFTDNSKPTILRGTVLETLDEMLDWYNLEYNITTTTKDEDGNDVTNTETFGVPHVLTDSQSVGDTITYNHEGTDVQATIVKEADVKHMMSKVSDTTDAKNVYGVFNCYDEEQSEEGYNDFLVASVGSFVVRIKSGETIAKGDLLQSNGDGTAKVQIDDNVKSSSFAKVLSTTIIETYEDGSYLVPCSLNC